MARPCPAQLPLLDIPPTPRSNRRGEDARARGERRAASSNAARYCNALLAELDKIAFAQTTDRPDAAEQLAELFAAAERAHAERMSRVSALPRDATSRGATSRGATSRGATSRGATSRGATSRGATSRGRRAG